MKLRKILLDTNFLIYCAKEKLDYLEQISNLVNEGYELVVPIQVVEELKVIVMEAKKYSDRQAAKLALTLLKVNHVTIINMVGKKADRVLIKLSKGNIVATHDNALKNIVERTIVIEGKRKLVLN